MADMLQFDKKSSDATDGKSGSTRDATPKVNTRRRYSSDEVADIIRISLQTESGNLDSTIDYEELRSIGKEMGVGDEQINRAVHLLEQERKTKDKERTLWARFRAHCVIFVSINLLCFIINLLAGTETLWFGYVLFGMGLFLLGHYVGLRYAPEFVQMAMDRTKLLASSRYQDAIEDDVNVGFTVADSSGLMESTGLVFIEEDKLIIEYQTVDCILGILKTGIKEYSVQLDDVVNAKLEQKFWSSELVLQSRSLRTFRNLPGSASGILRLKISRQSNTAALNLVDEITARE